MRTSKAVREFNRDFIQRSATAYCAEFDGRATRAELIASLKECKTLLFEFARFHEKHFPQADEGTRRIDGCAARASTLLALEVRK